MNPLKKAAVDLWNGNQKTRPNPWPTCDSCHRRQPPGSFCGRHPGIRMCIGCCVYSGNHPPRKDDEL